MSGAVLINTATGRPEWVASDKIKEAIDSGTYHSKTGRINVSSSDSGAKYQVDPRAFAVAEQQGYVPTSSAELYANKMEAGRDAAADTAWNKALTFSEGLASSLTMGAADIWMDDDATRRRARVNSGWRQFGDVVGMVAPALATGGVSFGATAVKEAGKEVAEGIVKSLAKKVLASTPSGMAARLSAKAGTAVGGKLAAGTIRQAASAFAVEGAIEGALWTTGQALSSAIIEDKEMSAEAVLAAITEGALTGGAVGGAFGTIGRGLKNWKEAKDAKAFKAANPLFDLDTEVSDGFRKQIVGSIDDAFSRGQMFDEKFHALDVFKNHGAKVDDTAARKLYDEYSKAGNSVKKALGIHSAAPLTPELMADQLKRLFKVGKQKDILDFVKKLDVFHAKTSSLDELMRGTKAPNVPNYRTDNFDDPFFKGKGYQKAQPASPWGDDGRRASANQGPITPPVRGTPQAQIQTGKLGPQAQMQTGVLGPKADNADTLVDAAQGLNETVLDAPAPRIADTIVDGATLPGVPDLKGRILGDMAQTSPGYGNRIGVDRVIGADDVAYLGKNAASPDIAVLAKALAQGGDTIPDIVVQISKVADDKTIPDFAAAVNSAADKLKQAAADKTIPDMAAAIASAAGVKKEVKVAAIKKLEAVTGQDFSAAINSAKHKADDAARIGADNTLVSDAAQRNADNMQMDGMVPKNAKMINETNKVKNQILDMNRKVLGSNAAPFSTRKFAEGIDELGSQMQEKLTDKVSAMDTLAVASLLGIDVDKVPVVGPVAGSVLNLWMFYRLGGAMMPGAKVAAKRGHQSLGKYVVSNAIARKAGEIGRGRAGALGAGAMYAAVQRGAQAGWDGVANIGQATSKLTTKTKDVLGKVFTPNIKQAAKKRIAAGVALANVNVGPTLDTDPKDDYGRLEAQLNRAGDPAFTNWLKEEYQDLRIIDPGLADVAVQQRQKQVQYLEKKLPKRPPEWPDGMKWAPKPSEMAPFKQTMALYVKGPMLFLDAIEAGSLTSEMVADMQALFPRAYKEVMDTVLEGLSQAKIGELPHKTQQTIRLLMQDASDVPMVSFTQENYEKARNESEVADTQKSGANLISAGHPGAQPLPGQMYAAGQSPNTL